MNFSHAVRFQVSAVFLLSLARPLPALDAPATPNRSRHSILFWRPSDQDVFLLITSIEWGSPDRWSFTSRYIHMFDKSRDEKNWLNNFTVSLSPGFSGGRLGIGYQCLVKPNPLRDIVFFCEARAVLLRTWGHPLIARAGSTFLGAEIRGSLAALVNLGAGYFRQVATAEGNRDSFWGIHVGIGI